MTRATFNDKWKCATGTHHLRGKAWKILRNDMDITTRKILDCYEDICNPIVMLAPLPNEECCKELTSVFERGKLVEYKWIPKEQGNNPMKTTTSISGVSIETPPSDASTQREYLLSRLSDMTCNSWRNPTYTKLSEIYNLNAPRSPKTSQEIIDAFKNGKVVIDQKKVDKQTAYYKAAEKNRDEDEDFGDDAEYESGITTRYFGITFTDLPVADRKGYDAAVAAYKKLQLDTKDTIMISDPAEGLAVLRAFEAWEPTATTTKH